MQMPPGLEKFEPINRWTLLRRAVKLAKLSGDFCEFGVAQGKSAKQILHAMPQDRVLYLFDSFEGLPETWHWDVDKSIPKGHFACKPPELGPRTKIVQGWFEDTLPVWLREERELAFLHIDSDLYSSAATVLTSLEHLFRPGLIIQFDEIHGYHTWDQDEWKAWCECVERTGIEYEWLGRSPRFRAALRITARK